MNISSFEKLVLRVKKELPNGDFKLNTKAISQVGKRIAKAINSNEKIAIYGDYDVDGIATSTMLKEFIEDVSKKINKYPEININISTRYTNGYGMSSEKVKLLAESHDLIIGVDHGANAEFLNLFDNKDYKMVVFDHHISDNKNYDFIINPATDGVKGISSGMVVKKFIDYFIDKTKIELNPEKYADLETLTIISDMAELNDYSRRRLEIGLNEINKKKRFSFKSNVGEIKHKDLSFGVISKINAVGRMRDEVSFVTEWLREDTDYNKWNNISTIIDEINDEKKKLVNKFFNLFLQKSELEKSAKNNLRLYVADDIPIGLNGLIAQRLFQYTNRETIVMSLHNNKYTGSGRGYDIYNSLKKIQEAIGSIENNFHFGGHHAAIGLNFKKEFLDKFSFHCLNSQSEKKKEIEIIDSVSVTELKNYSELMNEITEGIPLNRKFWFSLENYDFKDIKRFKNNYATVQISDGEATINCFLSLDMINEEHIRGGFPIRVSIDELYEDKFDFKFSLEAPLKNTFSNNVAFKEENKLSLRVTL